MKLHGAGGGDRNPMGGFEGIADRLPIYISYADAEGRLQYANPALLRALGKPLDMPAGVHLRELLGEAIFRRTESQVERVMHGETVCFLDTSEPGAARRHVELTFLPDRDPQGRVQGYFGIGYDLTERARREALVASREQQLTSILNAMAEGLVIHDREGRLIEANPAAEELLSLTRSQLFDWDIARPHWEAIDENGQALGPEDLPVIRTLRSGKPTRACSVGIRILGRPIRWLSINAEPLYDGRDPRPSGVVGTFSDVTAMRNSVERIRTLMRRVEDVREEERRELGLLLHEGVAQDLFSMRLALGNLERELQGAQAGAVRELSHMMDRCLADTRQIAGSLRPTGRADRPISEVIAQHARYFEGLSKLRIRVHTGDLPPVTDETTRLLLFRAAQEALTNCARHAHATEVHLFLGQAGNQIELRVVDNGIGIPPDAIDKAGSLGLMGMSERARSAGGSLEVQGSTGVGTTLILRLPLVRSAGAAVP